MSLNTMVMKGLKPFKPIIPLHIRRWIVFRMIEHEVGIKMDSQVQQGCQLLLTELAKCETHEQRKRMLGSMRERWARIDQAERNKVDEP